MARLFSEDEWRMNFKVSVGELVVFKCNRKSSGIMFKRRMQERP